MTTTPEEAARQHLLWRLRNNDTAKDLCRLAADELESLLAEREAGREAVIEECAVAAESAAVDRRPGTMLANSRLSAVHNGTVIDAAKAIRALSRPQREGEE